MNRKALLFLCLISLLLSLLGLKTDVQALGTDIFVSADGDGTNCTQDAPCLVAQALINANDGDRLYFRGGEYTGTGVNILIIDKGISLYGGWNGAPTGPIDLDPQTYTTTFNGMNARRLILVDDTSSYPEPIRIIGFHFTGGKAESSNGGLGGAIYFKNGGGLVADNKFHNNEADYYGGAIYVESAHPVAIQSNVFTENLTVNGGGAIGVSFPTGATPEISIEGNQFLGGSANYGTAIYVSGAAVHITRNFLKGGSGDSAIILVTTGVASSKITNNVIVGSDKALDFSNAATDQHRVWNNTIVDCEVAIAGFQADLELINNIIADNGTSISVSGGTLTGSHNLFYNNTPPDPNPLTDNREDTAPSFVDAANDDYHLSEWSDAKDDGTTVDLLFDFDGEKRPFGSGYDIGADEFTKTLYVFLPLIQR